ncbi:hypothetical protein GCM10022210_04980 [Mucilaginibacter dorajii]|uniref:CHAT domain-containing protein n=1 Tax=Mucilaginibacter dorajii TaxID=692994 RepID=A0ABP7P5Z1_9SPHI
MALQIPCHAQHILNQSFKLQQADSLIEAGHHRRAYIILNKVQKRPQAETRLLQALVLSARILNENGDRVRAIEQLKSILVLPVLNIPQNIGIRTDAYLILAECYFGISKIEDFKSISDSVLQLAIHNHLQTYYRARAYTNLARYYAYAIVPNTGKPFLDSALSLYNNAPEKEKKYYNPVSIYTAIIDLNRDLDRCKLDPAINTVVKLVNGNYGRERYNQILLWQTIGGVFLDSINDNNGQNKEIIKRQHYKALFAYQRAKVILRTHYPSNHIGLVSVNNLCGLLNYNCGLFRSAENYFRLSKAILAEQKYPIDKYTLTYSKTYLWESAVKDSVYTGKVLLQKRKEELSEWIHLAPYWQSWMQINQNKSLHYFRDNYAKSPFDNIVRLCYQLYQTEKDPKYIDLAFKAQENGKNYFLNYEYKKRYHITQPVLPDIQNIQHQLSPKQAIISFSDLGSYYKSLYAIVITADTVSIKKIDFGRLHTPAGLPASDICENLTKFKGYSNAAYQVIFKPLKGLLNNRINALLVFPSTLSSYFKFDMMVSDTLGINSFSGLPYLNNNYQIRYDFSYQFQCLRGQLAKQKKDASTNIQAYIPDYTNTRFYSLPFFTNLGNSLKTAFDFNVFDHSSSNIANYKANAGKARIIQFAGHSSVNQFAAEDLKIAMDSTRKGDSRFLTMDDIINTKLQADLTVLSLCETGEGDTRVQDSYLNMAYWFTYAGSKSCLFSYWKLDDRSTSFILEKFYHYLALGMRKSDALRKAQQDYLLQAKSEEEKNPVYWAGLTLIGDDSPIKLEEDNHRQYWYFAVLLFTPLLILTRKRRKQHPVNYQRLGSDNK